MLTVVFSAQCSAYRADCIQFCNHWLKTVPSYGNTSGEAGHLGDPPADGVVTGVPGKLQYSSFCHNAICAIFPNFYNKFRPPRSLRTGEYSECLAENSEEIFTVHVDLDAKVENISFSDEYGEISFDMTIGLGWQDPAIDICVCSDSGDSEEKLYYEDWEIFWFAQDFEHFMWTPDLDIWNVESVKKENYLNLLNDIFIRQVEGCPPRIFLLFKMRSTIRCKTSMNYFPFDKNICHFRIGSDSFAMDTIKFNSIHPPHNRIEVDDYYVYQRDLTNELRYVSKSSPAPSKRVKRFKVAGFSVIVERVSTQVLYRYGPALTILSVVNVFTWLVPHNQNKLGLLTCVLVSYMLEMTHLLETTPRVVEGWHASKAFRGYNFIVMYGFYNIYLIMATFAVHCFVVFLQRIWSRVNNKVILCIDWIFFIIHTVFLVVFNLYWWIYNPNFPPPGECHNNSYNETSHEMPYKLNCQT